MFKTLLNFWTQFLEKRKHKIWYSLCLAKSVRVDYETIIWPCQQAELVQELFKNIPKNCSWPILNFKHFENSKQSHSLQQEFKKRTARIEEKHGLSNMSCDNSTKKRNWFSSLSFSVDCIVPSAKKRYDINEKYEMTFLENRNSPYRRWNKTDGCYHKTA